MNQESWAQMAQLAEQAGYQDGLKEGAEAERKRFKERLEKLRSRFMDEHDVDSEQVVIEAIYLIYEEEETE